MFWCQKHSFDDVYYCLYDFESIFVVGKSPQTQNKALIFSRAPNGAYRWLKPIDYTSVLAYSRFLKILKILQNVLAYSRDYMLVQDCNIIFTVKIICLS